MRCFFRQSKELGSPSVFALVMLVQITALLINGCQDSRFNTTSPTFGHSSDITEDLYHRLKAGLFEPEKDAVIAHIQKTRNFFHKLRLPFYDNDAPHTMVRISWDRGSFWVKSDDHAYVVIYMDAEAIFSHVQIDTFEGFGSAREFRNRNEKPIR